MVYHHQQANSTSSSRGRPLNYVERWLIIPKDILKIYFYVFLNKSYVFFLQPRENIYLQKEKPNSFFTRLNCCEKRSSTFFAYNLKINLGTTKLFWFSWHKRKYLLSWKKPSCVDRWTIEKISLSANQMNPRRNVQDQKS